MSNNRGPRGGLWDELTADPLTLATVVIFLALVGPTLLIGFRDQVIDWLVAHQVLVTHEQAVVVVPWTSAGLDTRRLLVLAMLLLALGAALIVHRKAASGWKRGDR